MCRHHYAIVYFLCFFALYYIALIFLCRSFSNFQEYFLLSIVIFFSLFSIHFSVHFFKTSQWATRSYFFARAHIDTLIHTLSLPLNSSLSLSIPPLSLSLPHTHIYTYKAQINTLLSPVLFNFCFASCFFLLLNERLILKEDGSFLFIVSCCSSF